MSTEERPGDILDTPQAGGRVIRGSGLRIGAQLSGLLFGVVSTPLVIRHLGPADYGSFQTVGSLIFMVTGITEGGLGNLGVREYSTLDPVARAAFMRHLLGLRLVLTSIGALLAIGFAVAAGYKSVLVYGTLLASLGMLISVAQLTISIPLAAHLRLGSLGALDFVRQFVTAALMVMLVVLGASLLPFYAVSAAAAATVLALTAKLVRKETPLLPRVNRSTSLALLRQTLVYAAASALGVAYFQIAMLAMSLLSNAHQRGLYAVPFRIVDLSNTIPWLVVGSGFPILARAARDDAQRLRYALHRLVSIGVILGGGVALVAVVGAPFAIHLVGGRRFSGSIPVLRILGIGIPMTYLVATWSFGLLALHRHRALMICNAVALLAALILSGVLISSDGARGGGIVTAALEVILATAYGIALIRSDRDLTPHMGPILRIALALGVALAVGLVLPIASLVATISAVAVYGALLFALGAFPAELWLAVRRRA